MSSTPRNGAQRHGATPSAGSPSQAPRPRSLLAVLAFLRSYPRWVGLSLGLLLVNITIELSLPQILGSAITRLERASLLPSQLWRLVALFAGLILIRAAVGCLLGRIRSSAIQATLADIRAALYDALQRLGFGFHDRSNTGELVSRSTTDISRLQDFLFACLLLSVDIAVSLVVTVAIIWSISALLGGLTLATMIPTLVLVIFYAAKLRPKWRNVHDLHGNMTTALQENIAGVRVVKAFAREQAEIAKFRAKRDVFLGTLLRTVDYWATRVPFAQFVFGLSVPLMLWVGGRLVIDGRIPVGDLAKVVFYLMAIGHRLGMVGQFTNIIQNASASAERVMEILHAPDRLPSGSQPLPPGKGQIVFEEVSFAYAGCPASLEGISFVAAPGQTLAIVGASGSGKSTLVHLAPRFYDPTAGRVLVDGVDARQLRLDELRRSVGIIFQETFLFSSSVAENIAYGRPEARMEEIIAAARVAQAHEFIMELPEGYQTIIGERGVSLSGGQRQRLAIARAYLMNPRILILDDATASVDSQTERLIREGMLGLSKGRTTLVVAHRLATARQADRVLVLEAGRIVEQGTHSELIISGRVYQELFARQLQPDPAHG